MGLYGKCSGGTSSYSAPPSGQVNPFAGQGGRRRR